MIVDLTRPELKGECGRCKFKYRLVGVVEGFKYFCPLCKKKL